MASGVGSRNGPTDICRHILLAKCCRQFANACHCVFDGRICRLQLCIEPLGSVGTFGDTSLWYLGNVLAFFHTRVSFCVNTIRTNNRFMGVGQFLAGPSDAGNHRIFDSGHFRKLCEFDGQIFAVRRVAQCYPAASRCRRTDADGLATEDLFHRVLRHFPLTFPRCSKSTNSCGNR